MSRNKLRQSTYDITKTLDLNYRRQTKKNIIDINQLKSGCIQYKFTTFELEEYLIMNDSMYY